jgi:hypothetical protein
MGYIAHFTPDAVLKDAKYKEWMQSFGERCLHLIVNGTGEAVPLTDGLYRQQHMLNEICPDLFPAIFLIDFRENVTQVRQVIFSLTNKFIYRLSICQLRTSCTQRIWRNIRCDLQICLLLMTRFRCRLKHLR